MVTTTKPSFTMTKERLKFQCMLLGVVSRFNRVWYACCLIGICPGKYANSTGCTRSRLIGVIIGKASVTGEVQRHSGRQGELSVRTGTFCGAESGQGWYGKAAKEVLVEQLSRHGGRVVNSGMARDGWTADTIWQAVSRYAAKICMIRTRRNQFGECLGGAAPACLSRRRQIREAYAKKSAASG